MKNLIVLISLLLSLFLVATASAAVALPDLSFCSLNVSEDTSSSCVINSPNVTVSNQLNLICTLTNSTSNNYTLSYVGFANYNGVASCLINSTDGTDSNSSLLSIVINPVNDAPVINSYSPSSPVNAIPNVSKTFIVNATDVDNSVTINWYIGGVFIQSGRAFNFTRTTGTYTLLANATDGSLSSSVFWIVNVGPLSQYTCGQVGGFYYSGDKPLCPGEIFTSSDTSKCCSVPYIPAFSDASGCSIANKSVQISFTEPQPSDLFELGEQVNGDFRITNLYSQDQDFDVTAYLYDLTSDTYEASKSDDLSLRAGQSSSISLALKIPEDLDLTDDFVIMVKAEDELCNMNYIPVAIRRPKHIVKITSFFLPERAYCGETINAEVKIENSGSSDENVYLNLNNKNLSLDKSTDNFNLEKYSGSNKVEKTISFIVPDNVANGTYPIRLSLYYSDSNRMEFISKNLDVTGCRTSSYSTSSSTSNAENQTESSNIKASPDAGRIMILAAISLVLIIAILFVLYRVKTIKTREVEEVLNKPVRKTKIRLER
jgi:hypothetical protein